jgi:hypothetical protein
MPYAVLLFFLSSFIVVCSWTYKFKYDARKVFHEMSGQRIMLSEFIPRTRWVACAFQNNSAPTQGKCGAFWTWATLMQPRIISSLPNWLLIFRWKIMCRVFGHAMWSAIYLFLEGILQNRIRLKVFFLIQVYYPSKATRHAMKTVIGVGGK